MIDPSEHGEEEAAKESLLLEQKTAVEIDEDRLPLFRNENVPFVSQVQVDHASQMDFPEDLLQAGEKRGQYPLPPIDWLCRDKLHGKGEAVDPLHRMRYIFDPSQPGIDLPFFLNQPKPHCPSRKKFLSPDVLDHE